MKNTEADYTAEQKAMITMMDKGNRESKKKNELEDPNENEGRPPVILPITDTEVKTNQINADNATKINNAVLKASDEELDSGKNYTAAENDHNANATL